MNAKIILAAGAIVALAGCAGGGINEAEMAQPQGSEFDNALSAGYLRLARAEQGEADYGDADYFAERAVMSAQGKPVPLPEANARDLPQGDAIYVLALREELNEVLEGSARTKAPQLAATAQIAYECWTQELEENLQPDEIAACRDQLDGLIPALRNAIAEEQVAAAPKPAPKKLPRGKTFKVFFPTGGTRLDAEANKIIADAVAHAGQYPTPRVVVSGYTDTVGSADSNQALSAKRARVVAAAVRIRGVDRDNIKAQGFGEDFQDMSTADGVNEPKNRRVEIQVGGN